MKSLCIGIALLLCLCAVSWALEEDAPAIVGVWLFDGNVSEQG